MVLGGLLVSLAENKKADLRQYRTIPAAPRSPYRHLELCGVALNFQRHSMGARFTKKQRQETMKPVYLILAKLILAKLIIKQITTQTSAIIRPGIWEPLRLPELLFW